MDELIKELTAIKNISEVTNKQVLSRAKEIETKKFQKAMLDSLKDNKESNMVSKTKCRTESDQYIAKQTSI